MTKLNLCFALKSVTILLSVSATLTSCGDGRIKFVPGERLTNVLDNFEGVQGRVQAQEDREQKIFKLAKDAILGIAPDEFLNHPLKRMNDVTYGSGIYGGVRGPRLSGEVFSVKDLRAISVTRDILEKEQNDPSSDELEPIDVNGKDKQSAEASQNYYDPSGALWEISNNMVRFQEADSPILIQAKTFILDRGEEIYTSGRDLIIVAGRAIIHGKIDLQPEAPKDKSAPRRPGGRIKIYAHTYHFKETMEINASGEPGRNVTKACIDAAVPKLSPSQRKLLKSKLKSEFYVQQESRDPRIPPMINRMPLKGIDYGVSEASELNSLIVSAPLDLFTDTNGRSPFHFSSNEEWIKHFREYWDEFKDKVVIDGASWIGPVEVENGGGFDRAIRKGFERFIGHLKNGEAPKFNIGTNSWKVFLQTYFLLYKETLRNDLPYNAPTHFVAPHYIEGYDQGGLPGEIGIYSSFGFENDYHNLIAVEGSPLAVQKLKWDSNQIETVFGDLKAREISLVEELHYKRAIFVEERSGDKASFPLGDDSWKLYGSAEYERVAFEIEEDNSLPNKWIRCEPNSGTYQKSIRRSQPVLSSSLGGNMLGRLNELGLPDEVIPTSFKVLQEIFQEIDALVRAMESISKAKQ